MISSESSDEEFETLHQQQLAPRKKRRVDAAAKPVAASPVATPSKASDSDNDAAAPRADHVVLPEMSREEKKAIRKKRRLDKREEIARKQDEKTRRATEHERQLKGRAATLTIAVPGSIVENAQTKELKSYLAGQIARAAAIYEVDEIVIFDDQLGSTKGDGGGQKKRANDPHVFMRRILQYLETPQYLRRALFPMHSDLSCAGLLNPLDCPHHLRSDEWSVYREGVVVDRPLKDKEGSHVNVGLQKEVVVDKRIQPGIRVTVKIDEATKDHKKKSAFLMGGERDPHPERTTNLIGLCSDGHARVVGRAARAGRRVLGLHGAIRLQLQQCV
jgi:methyltransferase